MTHNNSSILSDVSTCLRDAMDSMFNNNHTIIIPENNNMNFNVSNTNEPLSAEALKSMMNKRKLASNVIIDEEQQDQESGHDNAKRLCTMNDLPQQEQKT